MELALAIPGGKRVRQLRDILEQLRGETYARVRDFRRDRDDDMQLSPGDEMDAARSNTDIETHASLIERAEGRLRAIDEALARVERGTYGVCGECGEEIPIARLRAVPFAAYCVDCQEKRQKRGLRGGMLESYGQRWVPASELESQERRFESPLRHEGVGLHVEDSFAPDEELEEESEVPKRRRGRPRKVASR